jgi:hypothetical protein
MSDTAPKDQRALAWNAPKPAERTPQPGEKLFEFLVGHKRHLCELRDHGQWGVEAQFFVNEEFVMGYRHKTRELAIAWAQREREAIEKDGA